MTSLRFILLALCFTTVVKSQTLNFSITPQSQCYSPGNNTSAAAITGSVAANNFYWSILSPVSCSASASSYTGNAIVITYPCCGIYTITCTAFNGTTAVGVMTKTASVICNSQITINNAMNLYTCPGNPITISASGGSNYIWSTGGTGPSIVVSPTATTCYSVTSLGGCSNGAVACVTVIPGIQINGNTNICPGSSTTLTATGSLNYTWMPGGMTGSVIVVSPSVSTCYFAHGSNPATCNYDSICVTVGTSPSLNIAGPSTVCSGSNLQLIASGANSYTWNTGANGSSIVVFPTANTCYTVSGYSPGCGILSGVKCVTVLPNPVINVSGNTTVCAGYTTTLTATGANTYTWYPTPGSAYFGNPFVLTPNSTVCYSVAGKNSQGCVGWNGGCVNVLGGGALSISGPSVICPGGTAVLTASGSTSYTWLPGNLTGNSVTVSPTSNTCYTVLGYNGQCNSSAVKCVAVQSLQVVTNVSQSVSCQGSSILLFGSGATSYTWYPFNLTGTPIVITPSASGCYTVIGSNGGCTGSASKCYTVLPAPSVTVSGPNVICAGSSAILSASGGSSYTWSPGGMFGPTVNVTPSVSTCYTVTTINGGCSGSAVKCVSVTPGVQISGNNVVCAGSSATLVATGSSGGYTWTPGGFTGSVIVVSPSVNTCYVVQGINAGGCNTATMCLYVQTLSLNISGPNNTCAGNQILLTASGANSYVWSNGATSPTVVVSPTATTCYTVTGFSPGCGTVTAVKCVSVNPNPVITVSGNSVVCAGSTTTLTASGANTYTWNTTAGTYTGNTVVLTPTSTVCYTLIGVSQGCMGYATGCIFPQSSTVSVLGTSVICPGGTAILTASGTSNYTWMPGGMTGFSVAVSPSVSTCYTAIGYNGNCFSSGVKCITVQQNGLNITTSMNPPVVCPGNTMVLTASGATSYTWAPFNVTGSQIVITPTASGCYTVTGSNGGCTGSATGCYSVVPSLPVTISGGGVICAGNSVYLVGSGGSSYTWMPGGLTGSVIAVSPSVNTCYTVIASNGACTGSAVKCVTVSPAPVLSVTGNTSICNGAVTSLIASGATSYTWNIGVTGNSITVSPTVSTCYVVMGTNANGCVASKTICVNVSNGQGVSIMGNNNICQGQSTTLFALGATNYTWSNGATSPSIVVSPTTTITYTVIGSGNCGGQATITVHANPYPTISAMAIDSVICLGDSTFITATGAQSYTWSNGMTGSTIMVTPTVSTWYTVIGSVNGCNGYGSASVHVINCNVGLPETEAFGLDIYPNPASQQLTLKTREQHTLTYVLYDLTGREILTGSFSGNTSVNLSEYAAGTYILRCEDGSRSTYRRIIVER